MQEKKLVDRDLWVQDGEEIISMEEAHKRYGEGKFPQSIIGNCFTFSEYSHLPLIPPPGWIGEGILPLQSKLLLFGEPKSGKSFMAMQMGWSIAENKPWLGFDTTNSDVRVLYIQAEIAAVELLSRLRNLPTEFAYAETIHSLRLLGEQVELLSKRIEAVKPNVLILDPLYMFITGDLTEISDVTKCNSIIDRIIDEYGCSVIVVHHSRKPKENTTMGIMEALGSIAITAFYDSILWIEQVSKDAAMLCSILRNAKSPEPVLITQDDRGLWQRIDIDPMCFMTAGTAQELAIRAGVSENVMQAYLSREITAGKMGRDTWGKYARKMK